MTHCQTPQSFGHVMFGGFTHKPAVELAEKCLAVTPASLTRVFYSDNGSTAIEVALKMSLQYWKHQTDKKHNLLASKMLIMAILSVP